VWAVHFIIFIFCCSISNCLLCLVFRLVGNGLALRAVAELKALYYQSALKVNTSTNFQFTSHAIEPNAVTGLLSFKMS
jgi:hypothetical protein